MANQNKVAKDNKMIKAFAIAGAAICGVAGAVAVIALMPTCVTAITAGYMGLWGLLAGASYGICKAIDGKGTKDIGKYAGIAGVVGVSSLALAGGMICAAAGAAAGAAIGYPVHALSNCCRKQAPGP